MTQILEHLNNHPKEIKRVIGITNEEFKKLIENAQIIAENKKMEMRWQEKRLIKTGGGRKKSLKFEEEIILTLYYLRHLPTFQILGIYFGVSESTANNIFHYWIDVLQELLPSSLLEQLQEKEDEYLWI
ncbi:MAG: transposase family protein [Okeania sp. SIO2F4]|uniref:helix-turn-helix domain-containing protein n=1 Tax=Okeania sp. SIO2F4 TaxID=2607790 RepID=UPI00142BD853|nr:transposase family protein [Okeania sp. SIO2F4]MDJ0514694.1 transposase family protein [Trichodesmium sp. MO_231.B1]NES03334.1 transposase family protein [Okeania sp. SIO2F4]